jgi:hypothetical protein
MTIQPWTPLRPGAVLLIVALVGCHGTPPGSLVGESQHFRLYIDPDAAVPAGLDGDNALAALEAEWADVHRMLQMPEGKITYYWLSSDHISAACEQPETNVEACFWPRGLEVDAPTLPLAHELNHAYMYLLTQRIPFPFLAEGAAEAIECGAAYPMPADLVPWEGAVVAYPPSLVPYAQGGAFVRYLIRTYGSAEFVRYYQQAPEERDPALFAANFQSFWGITIDDAWIASHEVSPGTPSFESGKICPCSLPPLEPLGAVTNDPARAPYWSFPETSGQTLALSPQAGGRVSVMDCAGILPILGGPNVLARISGGPPRYVLAPLETATIGNYLADDCADAAPFSGPIVAMQFGGLTIAITPPPSGSETLYLNLASSFSGTLRAGLTQTCDTCAFDQASCQPLAGGAMPEVQGPLFGRATLEVNPTPPTQDLLSDEIDILGQ